MTTRPDKDSNDAVDHLVDRRTRRAFRLRGCWLWEMHRAVAPDRCRKVCGPLVRSWTREGARRRANEKANQRASWAWRIIYWLINEDVLHYGSDGSRGRLLSLGTGIIWRPNIYDRVLLLDRLPVRPDTARERGPKEARGPITMYPDLTVIRGPGISSVIGGTLSLGVDTALNPADKGSRLNAKEASLARCRFLPRKIVKAVRFNISWRLSDTARSYGRSCFITYGKFSFKSQHENRKEE